MITSDSDGDFESADEEFARSAMYRRNERIRQLPPKTVDSDSDDGIEYMDNASYRSPYLPDKTITFQITKTDAARGRKITSDDKNKVDSDVKVEGDVFTNTSTDSTKKTSDSCENKLPALSTSGMIAAKDKNVTSATESCDISPDSAESKSKAAKPGKSLRSPQQKDSSRSGMKKLGTKITKEDIGKSCTDDVDNINTKDIKTELSEAQKDEGLAESSNKELLHSTNTPTDLACNSPKQSDDLSEMDMPEELKSDKKFKEVFQPEGWEGIGNDIKLPGELGGNKLHPASSRFPFGNKESQGSLGSWSDWGNWGVTSLINTATASVSTLTSHVSQGFTLLEGTIGVPDPVELAKKVQDEVTISDDAEQKSHEQESQSYSPFGLGNLMSGVSSITKLVESTGSKVMTGGLDTLEAIGKKTMQVLQDGDPGLKKKRAFFMNETDKPILSQVLRDAKEKAETEEKTIEERQSARKVHFESLFDDYQGLVHLEALEMLSKQSNMKIQQHLNELNVTELTSAEEMLREIKELCDLGDEDGETNDKDLKHRLEHACSDLIVDITYEKLHDIWVEADNYLAVFSTYTTQEIFQKAISTLAQFTAFSVERFHKTAELLLIKERRNTVNEADALVRLTNILSNHVSLLANMFCNTLNEFSKTSEDVDKIKENITAIFLEATNANSYIQDAFTLFIPILQVGAI